jgi:hypothetical protein
VEVFEIAMLAHDTPPTKNAARAPRRASITGKAAEQIASWDADLLTRGHRRMDAVERMQGRWPRFCRIALPRGEQRLILLKNRSTKLHAR